MKKKYSLIVGAALFAMCFMAASPAHAIFITSAADSALVGGNVITFTGQANGVYEPLTIDGVTFGPKVEIGSTNYGVGGIHQAVPYLSNGYFTIGTSDSFYTAPLNFSFSQDISAFGFYVGAVNSDWSLAAYDSSNNMLDQAYTVPGGNPGGGAFYGISTPGSSIAYAILSTGTAQDYIFIDDFTTGPQNTNAVPEPATMVLLGTGLAGMALRKRFV